ncbi:hypothetical protein H7X69_02190 [Candidatus Saccharibacteria bacterium]|nr:hypothetical protein [Candidatus Saccharibacteria bacterium]
MKSIIRTKKAWLVVGAATVLFVLALGYLLYSLQIWRNYEQDYQVWQTTTKNDLSTVLSLPMTSSKEREQKLAKLKAIAVDLNTQQANMCRISPLTGWQANFNGIETVQKQCNTVTSKVKGFITELGVTTAYLTDERILANSLATLTSQPTQPDEKTWAQVAAVWHKFGVEITAMKPDVSFKSTNKVAVTVVTGIDTAWQELLAAHSAQNKARFVTAQAGLAAAYNTLGTITAENDKQLSLLDKKLSQAYSAAF